MCDRLGVMCLHAFVACIAAAPGCSDSGGSDDVADAMPSDSGADARATATGGGLVWVRTGGGAGGAYPLAITALGDGGCVVVGSFDGSFILGESPNATTLLSEGPDDVFGAPTDVFAARFDSDGALVWARQDGGYLRDESHVITALDDGTILVGGAFSGHATFGNGESNETTLNGPPAGPTPVFDRFAAAYYGDGSLLWAKHVPGAAELIPVASSSSGAAFFLVGTSQGEVTFDLGETTETTLTEIAPDALFIASYGNDGKLLWAESAASGSAYNVDATSMPNGGLVLTGRFGGPAPITFGAGEANEAALTPIGDLDLFVARYDVDGAFLWARHAVGVEIAASGIVGLEDEGLILAGNYKGISTFNAGQADEESLASAGEADAFLVRFDHNGDMVWTRHDGGTGVDLVQSAAARSDGSTVVAGTHEGAATFGAGEPNETTLPGHGRFLARYDADGSLQWAESTTVGVIDGNAVALLADGVTLMTGYFSTGVTFGPGQDTETQLTVDGLPDLYLAHFAP